MSQFYKQTYKRKVFVPCKGIEEGYLVRLINSIIRGLSLKAYKKKDKNSGNKVGVLCIYRCIKDSGSDPKLESRYVIELAIYKSK